MQVLVSGPEQHDGLTLARTGTLANTHIIAAQHCDQHPDQDMDATSFTKDCTNGNCHYGDPPMLLSNDEAIKRARAEARRLYTKAMEMEKNPTAGPPTIVVRATNDLMGALRTIGRPASAAAVLRIVNVVKDWSVAHEYLAKQQNKIEQDSADFEAEMVAALNEFEKPPKARRLSEVGVSRHHHNHHHHTTTTLTASWLPNRRGR